MLFTIAVVGKTGGTAPELAVGTVYTAVFDPVAVLEKLLKLSAKEKTPCCGFVFYVLLKSKV